MPENPPSSTEEAIQSIEVSWLNISIGNYILYWSNEATRRIWKVTSIQENSNWKYLFVDWVPLIKINIEEVYTLDKEEELVENLIEEYTDSWVRDDWPMIKILNTFVETINGEKELEEQQKKLKLYLNYLRQKVNSEISEKLWLLSRFEDYSLSACNFYFLWHLSEKIKFLGRVEEKISSIISARILKNHM